MNTDQGPTIIGKERQPFHDLLMEIMMQSGDADNQTKIRAAFSRSGTLSDDKYKGLKDAFEIEYPAKTKWFSS